MANGGYWGIGLEINTIYRISFWAKKGPDFNGTLKATLESNRERFMHNRMSLNRLKNGSTLHVILLQVAFQMSAETTVL